MLDEVRSLLQKALRRQSPLAFEATKELLGYEKDQLPWKSIVTFAFEDHCLNHVDFFKSLYELYTERDKYKCIELIHRSYTCRYAACLQVVSLADEKCPEQDYFRTDLPPMQPLLGLVQKEERGIDMDLVLANIVKYWQDGNTKVLARLFVIVNMAAKVEKRKLTRDGVRYLHYLDVKRPSLYHLVISVLYQHTADEYMKELIDVCFKFSLIPDVPQGLILFTVLTNLIHIDAAKGANVDYSSTCPVNWKDIKQLNTIPSWAVDKHTFRGKFGKQSKHIFLKKFKGVSHLSEAELEEFHGTRAKRNIEVFFEEGCVCFNEILPSNPIWEDTKKMYFKQKLSQQKTSKMTQSLYSELRKDRNRIFGQKPDDAENPEMTQNKLNRKRKICDTDSSKANTKKQKLEAGTSNEETSIGQSKTPTGPLLQLPTGSAKVYTRLDNATGRVWKGPYRTPEKMYLCKFFHRAMIEVFKDNHTLQYEQRSRYLTFPLIQLVKGAKPPIKLKAFYDCIAKKNVKEEDGEFVERSSLGIIQLHKMEPYLLEYIPTTVWAHFAFRYVLNVGDSGLYNAIALNNLTQIYGIDMEENRNQVRGNSVLDLIFVKQPNKILREIIERKLINSVEEFSQLICQEFDFSRLRELYRMFGVSDQTDRCKVRLVNLKMVLDRMCVREIGI